MFLEPGTGKTKIAIDFCGALFEQHKATRVLVVCQLTGHRVWTRELRKHCAVDYMLIPLPRGSKEKIRALQFIKPTTTRLTVVLVNYESIWRIEEALVRYNPHVIIFDEGHKIKDRSSKQSRCAHRLVEALNPYRLLLTGTAIANSPLDVFSEYRAIDSSVFGTRYRPFEQSYAIRYGYGGFKFKYKNLGDLRRRARSKATVLTKEECLDLPTRSYEHIRVDLSGATRKAYNEMAEWFITYTESGEEVSAAIKLTQLLRLSQITGGFATTEGNFIRQLGHDKLDALEDKLEELINANEKVVVFARFTPEVEAIYDLCQKRKWKSWKYHGKGNAQYKREREFYPERFQSHKGPGVFVAQTQTGSLSIELYAAAYGIFYSFDYSLINWTQCHDRIHRGGQTRKVIYYYISADDTLDYEIWNTLHNKKGVASLLNNESEFLRLVDAI